MPTPTVPVTVTLASQDGVPYEGITVRARLDINEVYEGMVISDQASGVTSALGVAVIDCFPNAPSPTGLGTQGSTYRFTAAIPGGRGLNVDARVPNTACRLENILVQDPVVALDDAELALLQAQAAVTTAASSASAAAASAAAADVSEAASAASAAAADASEATAVAQAAAASASASAALTSQTAAAASASSAATSATSAAVSAVDAANNASDGRGVNVVDYTALRAYSGSAATVAVTGYLATAAPGAIAGSFTRDDNDTTSADNGGTIIVATNGKRWKRLYDGAVNFLWFVPEAQHAAIRVGTSTFDCSSAMTAALASFPNSVTQGVNPSGFYVAVPEIHFQSGKYYFASTIELKKTVRLTGEGAGHPGGYATLFQFAADTTGIRIHAYNTIGETTEVSPTTAGSGSVITGLALFGTFSGTTGHGIHMRGMSTIEDCNIVGFAGNGVHIEASVGAGGAGEGNANTWRARDLRIQQCKGHGFYLNGADANAGVGESIDATSNDKCGIFDSSFLGNTFIGCHTDGNGAKSKVHYAGNRYYCISDTLGGTTTPGTNSAVWVLIGSGAADFYHPDWVSGGTYYIGSAYRADSVSARSVFMGCYSEGGGQPPSFIVEPSVVVGGLHAAGFESASTGMVIGTNGDNISSAKFPSRTASSRSFNGIIGTKFRPDSFIEMLASGDHPSGLQLCKWHESSKSWGAWWADVAPMVYMTTSLSTETAGRSAAIGGGKFLFPNGYWLGDSNGLDFRRHSTAAAAPGSGEWARGDIVWNRDPSAGGAMGWVCVTGGTPGTWAEFGTVKLAGSATYDPPSLADGAGATTTVTVTGAALGDYAIASFSLDLQGITVTAWVSAANTVSVRFQNESGGALDLASGTLRAKVTKA